MNSKAEFLLRIHARLQEGEELYARKKECFLNLDYLDYKTEPYYYEIWKYYSRLEFGRGGKVYRRYYGLCLSYPDNKEVDVTTVAFIDDSLEFICKEEAERYLTLEDM